MSAYCRDTDGNAAPRDDIGRRHLRQSCLYCGSTPASLATPAQRSISESTNSPNFSPVRLGIALPLLAHNSLIFGEFSALTISSDILSTMSDGVPAGAHIAYQVETS